MRLENSSGHCGLRITLAALRLAGEKFRPLAWPLKSAFTKAKLQLFSRITNAEWPSSIARLRNSRCCLLPFVVSPIFIFCQTDVHAVFTSELFNPTLP